MSHVKSNILYVRARAVCYTTPNILLSPQTEGPSILGSCLTDKDKYSHQREATSSTNFCVHILIYRFLDKKLFGLGTGLCLPAQNTSSYEGWNFNSGKYLFTTDTK